MITRFWFGNRRPGLTAEAFSRHWFHTHAAFGLALPGLRAYVQNHRLVDVPSGWAPTFDGCSELDFEDLTAMDAAFASPGIAAADADERLFADPDRFAVVVTERQGWFGADDPDVSVRLLSLIRANPRADRASILPALLAQDTVARARATGAARAEVLVALDEVATPQACDLVLSLWFDTVDLAVTAAPTWFDDTAAALAGLAFGREHALVGPRRLRCPRCGADDGGPGPTVHRHEAPRP